MVVDRSSDPFVLTRGAARIDVILTLSEDRDDPLGRNVQWPLDDSETGGIVQECQCRGSGFRGLTTETEGMTVQMTSPPHIQWLKDKGTTLKTTAGQEVRVLALQHGTDEVVLSAWAKHFREHYCLDTALDQARQGTGLSRKEYLEQFVFPDQSAPGPTTRAGDFAEILVADYFEYLGGWSVPRTRYRYKAIPNESTKGTDILAFLLTKKTDLDKKVYSTHDVLMSIEVKAQFSGKKADARLQEAVDDSAKDQQFRKALSLNAMKMRLLADRDLANVRLVERFQNLADRPYQTRYTAAAFHCTCNYQDSAVTGVDVSKHPDTGNLALLLIKGSTMMQLVHHLYVVAANEA